MLRWKNSLDPYICFVSERNVITAVSGLPKKDQSSEPSRIKREWVEVLSSNHSCNTSTKMLETQLRIFISDLIGKFRFYRLYIVIELLNQKKLLTLAVRRNEDTILKL